MDGNRISPDPTDKQSPPDCNSPPPAYNAYANAGYQAQPGPSSQAPIVASPGYPAAAYNGVQQAWGSPPPPNYYYPPPGQPMPAPYYSPQSGMTFMGPPGQYPAGGYMPPQQQQQQVVMIGGGAQSQRPVNMMGVESFCGQIVFSCFVFWCCNCVFGLVGFILAMVANDSAVSRPHHARKLGHASYAVSSVGIAVTIIVVIVVVCVVSSSPSYTSCRYTYAGDCYSHRSTYSYNSYTGYSTCNGVYDGYYYCYY